MITDFDVCCVGHMCTDILVKPVDRLPERGRLETVDSVTLKTGGCAMNTALGLAKLGISTAIVGKAGDDGFGDFMCAALGDAGVDTGGLLREKGGMSSASVVTIGTDGERTILHSLGTNRSLCFDDIDIDIVLRSKYLFIGGYYLLPSFDGDGAARLLKEAKRHGVMTMMDTAWDASGKWLELIRPCLPFLDWFTPSVEEAENIFGSRDERKLTAAMKRMGVKNAVVKLGNDGCYIEPDGENGEHFGIFPANVVDTAGAGDAWCAGFLAGLVHGMEPCEAALLGNAAGAMCVTAVGTTTGIRSYDETLEFMEENKK